MNPFDKVAEAIQGLLDAAGDGYHLAHWVVVMGIQKMDTDGGIANSAWLAVPANQADYITDGLLANAEEMRADTETDDD